MEETNLMPFEGASIRRVWHNGEWYFSVVDVIAILTDSPNPSRYWADLKRRTEKDANSKVFAFCEPLKIQTAGGKQNVICANTEGVFRITMSVPSPKAEPLKIWMAQVSKERIEETENPELSFERMTEIYKAKGRSDEWVKERFQSIEARKRLTDEWKMRGVKEGQEYSILTATIAKGTFGLTPSEHGKIKGLEKQNLRDHMTPLELIFTSLSEEITRQVIIKDDAVGFNENHDAAVYSGSMTAGLRKKLEKDKGIKVVSKSNFLGLEAGNTEGASEEEKSS